MIIVSQILLTHDKFKSIFEHLFVATNVYIVFFLFNYTILFLLEKENIIILQIFTRITRRN